MKGMASAKYDDEIDGKRRFKHHVTGKIYTGRNVVFLDIDTMGPCFCGFITKKLWRETHNVDVYNKEYLAEII